MCRQFPLCCAYSPFSLFIWLHEAVPICSLVAVLVNYAICVSCHSRHQLAPLSRLYIWTASNLVLCCSEHDANLSWLDWKEGNVQRCELAYFSPWAFKSSMIIRHCASWIQTQMIFIHCCLIMWRKKNTDIWWKETKDTLSGMHLDLLIIKHLCKAKAYLQFSLH